LSECTCTACRLASLGCHATRVYLFPYIGRRRLDAVHCVDARKRPKVSCCHEVLYECSEAQSAFTLAVSFRRSTASGPFRQQSKALLPGQPRRPGSYLPAVHGVLALASIHLIRVHGLWLSHRSSRRGLTLAAATCFFCSPMSLRLVAQRQQLLELLVKQTDG
jgi:hypothetical protein